MTPPEKDLKLHNPDEKPEPTLKTAQESRTETLMRFHTMLTSHQAFLRLAFPSPKEERIVLQVKEDIGEIQEQLLHQVFRMHGLSDDAYVIELKKPNLADTSHLVPKDEPTQTIQLPREPRRAALSA